jgi:predicted choloylglycine hydrolase
MDKFQCHTQTQAMLRVQIMKLDASNPLTVMSICSNIAYVVKESKARQVTVKTDNGVSNAVTNERPFWKISAQQMA